jgi:hypothetical protein
MTARGWGFFVAALAAAALLTARAQPAAGTPLVNRVNPRPRLLFAPGEFARFSQETETVRREAFERLVGQIDSRGTRPWNERDLQLESQAIVARVLLDRGDPSGDTYLGYARGSARFFLNTHTFRRWDDSHQIVTEGGRWIEAMALAHDWLHTRWSDEERGAIAQWLAEEIEDWTSRNRLVRASASPFRNDAARGTAALILAGLTLYDEPGHRGDAQRALAYAQPYYEAILSAHAYAGIGGGMTEGTFYGSFTAWGQALATEALFTAAGDEDAYTRSPFFQARLRYATHAGWPGYITNQFSHNVHALAPVFGDGRRGPTGASLYHRATVLLLGKRFPQSAAAREAYWAVNRRETSRTYIAEWSLYDLLFWSPAVTPSAPRALGYREPSLGQVFSRSDWSDGATWMSFNAGPHLDTHQHYDAGNLTIFRQVDLLVDSGSFDDFGTSHWYNYYARTVAHNTITVTDPSERWADIWGGVPVNQTDNDGGQRTAAPFTPAPTLDEYLANRQAYDQARITRYSESAWGTYVRADLTNAYQNPAFQSTRPNGSKNGVKVTEVRRDVVFARRSADRRDTFVVFDRVVAADAGFRKAVLWHSREPFTAGQPGATIDAGETRYTGRASYDFASDVRFRQGRRDGHARLFVTMLAIDPINVRQIGRRISTAVPDHTIFGIPHYHRHVKDFYVEDPRGIVNTNRNLGAFGRTEWPPFAPPETQWLFTDDLAGGWGQTRLQVEPAGARALDRFLTVLVPADAGETTPPVVEEGRAADDSAAAAIVRDGGSTTIVVFASGQSGDDLTGTVLDLPERPSSGELIVTSLIPGRKYLVGLSANGPGARLGIAQLPAGQAEADQSGVIRLSINAASLQGGAVAGMAAGSQRTLAGASPMQPGPTGTGVQEGTAAPGASATGAQHPGLVTINATEGAARDDWAGRIARMLASGSLRVRETSADTMMPGRTHQRLSQMYKGVPVFGGEVTRQMEGKQTLSVFGTLYDDIRIDPVPKLTTSEAAAVFQKLAGASLGPSRTPELIVLPTDDGGYRLTYRARIATPGDVMMYFIDANTGETVLSFSDLKRPVL